jgi:hypothetical protein
LKQARFGKRNIKAPGDEGARYSHRMPVLQQGMWLKRRGTGFHGSTVFHRTGEDKSKPTFRRNLSTLPPPAELHQRPQSFGTFDKGPLELELLDHLNSRRIPEQRGDMIFGMSVFFSSRIPFGLYLFYVNIAFVFNDLH